MKTSNWVKRLGQWHLYVDGDRKTLCGKPMLGNNYDKFVHIEYRKRCDHCFNAKRVIDWIKDQPRDYIKEVIEKLKAIVKEE